MRLLPGRPVYGRGVPLQSIHFKEANLWLCHPERSEGSLCGERSFAALGMTFLPSRRVLSTRHAMPCIIRLAETALFAMLLRVPEKVYAGVILSTVLEGELERTNHSPFSKVGGYRHYRVFPGQHPVLKDKQNCVSETPGNVGL